MSKRVVCPSCSASNPADAARCHACGHQLLPPNGPSSAASPVLLQRIMGGEVFTALRSDTANRPSRRKRLVGSDAPVVQVDAPPDPSVEDHSDIIAAAVDRIRAKAQDEGHRFKPYVPSRNRKAPTAQGKPEVGRQLDAAVGLLRERRFEEAIEPLLKAIARDDEDRRSWILLAEAYLRIGRTYKAAVGYLRALELSPKDEQAWLGLSRVLRSLDELPTSAVVLDRAVVIHPDHAETWAERGLVREALQDLTEAERSFAKVLALRPDHRLAKAKRQALEAKRTWERAPIETSPQGTSPGADSVPMERIDEEAGADFLDEMEAELRAEQTRGPSPPAAASGEGTSVARPIESERPARVLTYVEGLDTTLEGGIPWGHVVLVEGAPGTMKSSVGFSILLQNAAREGLHCLYLSLEERTSSLLKQMGSLGLKLEVPKGSLVVLDPRTAADLLGDKADWVEALEEGIRSIKEQRGLDLIVIDSLEALEVLAKFKDRRREMYRLFEWLRDLDVTSFVITERPDWLVAGHVLQGRWDEDFLADGVFHLRIHMVSDLDAQRRLRVVKMRGTKHETGYLAMVLDDGRFRVTRAMSP